MQAESLAKLQRGGEQIVKVVHVHPGGQAIVGNVVSGDSGGANTPGGGGVIHENGNQPHAKADLPAPSLAPMSQVRREDPSRDALRLIRFLTLEVVARLGETLVTMESEGISPKVIAIARLWVLTGCRRNEIAALQRIEVDFELGCFRLVDTKTGRSVRPLAASARAILQATPRDPQSPYVFPCDDCPSFYQGTKRAGVTPQTLRHTLGSAAVSSGETLAMTGALLGHEDARSTSIYAHMQQDPARRAADRVVGPIATALGGGLASETTARTVQKQLIDPAS
jgi:integrase